MQKKFGKNDAEFQIMMEAWAFYQKNYLPESDDEWDRLIDEADAVAKRHPESLTKKIILAFVQDIEERSKK